MSVSQLQSGLFARSSFQCSEQAGSSKDADFLSFKLLNKRARIKISESPLDLDATPGRADLFTVAASKGWFAAVVRQAGADRVVLSPLSQLRNEITALTEEKAEIPFNARYTWTLPASASAIVFAYQDTRLLVALVNGSICIYDHTGVFSGASSPTSPLHTFQSHTGTITSILPNPEGAPELVAVSRTPNGDSGQPAVEILDLNNMSVSSAWSPGSGFDSTPVSLAWSPKGKQIALGMKNGGIIAFIPGDTSTPKLVIPPPPSLHSHTMIGLTWLSNSVHYAIYVSTDNPAADAEQTHAIISTDTKNQTVTYIRMDPPYMPFPGLRAASSFVTVFRDWNPVKYLLVVGDSASSDVGVLSCAEDWHILSLDEGSNPTLPLDVNMEDTVLVGLQLDLTSTAPYTHISASGASTELPPPPVLYAYASDGTLQAWHVVNSSGAPYTSPISPRASAMQATPSIAMLDGTSNSVADSPVVRTSGQDADMETTRDDNADSVKPSNEPRSDFSFSGMTLGEPNTSSSTTTDKPSMLFGTFGATPAPQTTSAFGSEPGSMLSSGFGAFGGVSSSGDQASPFTAPKPTASALGEGGTSTFGQPGLGSSASQMPTSAQPVSTFGQSGFGQSAFGQSSFGKPATTGGFGQSAFGQPAPAAGGFGQSAFGQSAFAPKTSATTAPASTTSSAFSGSGGFASFAGSGMASLSGQTTPKARESETEPAPDAPIPALARVATPATTTPKADEKAPSSSFGSTTPTASLTPSPFAASSAPSGFGAFGNLQTTPNAFSKPSGGYGAFGSSEAKANTQSPFFVAAANKSPGSSAFGGFASAFGGGTAVQPAENKDSNKPASSGSTFGSPSVFGSTSAFGNRSAFGSPSTFGSITSTPDRSVFGSTSAFGTPAATSVFASTTPPTTPKEPATGGFAAFSGATSPFGKTKENDTEKLKESVPDKGASQGEGNRGIKKEESLSNLSQLSSSFEKIDHESASQQGDDVNDDAESFVSTDFPEEEEDQGSVTPSEDSEGDDGRSFTPPEEEEDEQDGEGSDEDTAESDEGNEEEKTEDGRKIGGGEKHETPASPVSPVPSKGKERETTPKPASMEKASPSADIFAKSVTLTSTPFSLASTTVDTTRSPFSLASTTPPGSPAQGLQTKATSPSPPAEMPSEKSTLFGKVSSKPLRSSPLASGQVISPGGDSEPATKPLYGSSFPRADFPTLKAPTSPFALGVKPEEASSPLTLEAKPSASASPVSLNAKPGTPVSSFGLVPKAEVPAASPLGRPPPPVMSPFTIPPLGPPRAPSAFPPVSGSSLPFSFNKAASAGLPQPPARPVPIQPTQALTGLEAACHDLLTSVTVAFEELEQLGRQDTKDVPRTFTIEQVSRHGQVMTALQDDVDDLRASQAAFRRSIEHLNRDLLKVTTKKEEIVRFNKAKTDQGFARMLKSRTLGPDHVEMQTQLRRDLRSIRDRVKKLELYVDGGKKQLAHFKKSKPVIKASSLDMINRTMHNIETTITRERDDILSLSRRIGRLNPRDASVAREMTPAIEDIRLSAPQPSVAAVAAAALNAERSAQRLKRSLLSARKEPLFNTSAAPTLSTNSSTSTVPPKRFEPTTPSAFATEPQLAVSLSLPSESDDNFVPLAESQSPGLSHGSRRGAGKSKHLKPVALKKSPSPAPPTKTPPAFDWGPMPSLNSAPRTTLAFDVRAKSASSPGK